MRGYVIEQ